MSKKIVFMITITSWEIVFQSANAQDPHCLTGECPDGSYLQTCYDCSYKEYSDPITKELWAFLQCKCEQEHLDGAPTYSNTALKNKLGQDYPVSYLQVYAGCGDIGNYNGSLQCAKQKDKSSKVLERLI